MKRKEALKVLYSMACQSIHRRGSVRGYFPGYSEWPEAYEALKVIQSDVYPEGDNFVDWEIEEAQKNGTRMEGAFEDELAREE